MDDTVSFITHMTIDTLKTGRDLHRTAASVCFKQTLADESVIMNHEGMLHLILMNQYDTELTRRAALEGIIPHG